MIDTQQRYNFVDAEPMTPPRADLVRRDDIVRLVDSTLDIYRQQQASALAAVQVDTQRGGFLSTADQVNARRKTSGMYLGYYTGVVGMVAGGLVLLAHGAGYVDAGGAFATWLALTGGVALWLGVRMHENELRLTPEDLGHHVIDAHESIAAYEAETKRVALELEYAAEQSRQQQSAQAAADARALAADRMREIELRRDMQQAQLNRQYAVETPAITNQLLPSNDEPTVDQAPTWQRDLLQWVGDIFSQGRINDAGTILSMVPWSQRSAWTEPDKAQARRILCEIRPALVVHDGNRWRWRVDLVDTAEQAVTIVSHRF